MSAEFIENWKNGLPLDGNEAIWCWVGWQQAMAVSVPEAEYTRALQDAFDIIQADANTERNYGSLCRIGSVLDKVKDTPTNANVWIKCSERLPESGITVLVSNNSGAIYTCRRSVIERKNLEPDGANFTRERFTHLMPLPCPPK